MKSFPILFIFLFLNTSPLLQSLTNYFTNYPSFTFANQVFNNDADILYKGLQAFITKAELEPVYNPDAKGTYGRVYKLDNYQYTTDIASVVGTARIATAIKLQILDDHADINGVKPNDIDDSVWRRMKRKQRELLSEYEVQERLFGINHYYFPELFGIGDMTTRLQTATQLRATNTWAENAWLKIDNPKKMIGMMMEKLFCDFADGLGHDEVHIYSHSKVMALWNIMKGMSIMNTDGKSHCDLKPGNIMMELLSPNELANRRNAGLNPFTALIQGVEHGFGMKIIDFGASVAFDKRCRISTPGYKAPYTIETSRTWMVDRVNVLSSNNDDMYSIAIIMMKAVLTDVYPFHNLFKQWQLFQEKYKRRYGKAANVNNDKRGYNILVSWLKNDNQFILERAFLYLATKNDNQAKARRVDFLTNELPVNPQQQITANNSFKTLKTHCEYSLHNLYHFFNYSLRLYFKEVIIDVKLRRMGKKLRNLYENCFMVVNFGSLDIYENGGRYYDEANNDTEVFVNNQAIHPNELDFIRQEMKEYHMIKVLIEQHHMESVFDIIFQAMKYSSNNRISFADVFLAYDPIATKLRQEVMHFEADFALNTSNVNNVLHLGFTDFATVFYLSDTFDATLRKKKKII